MGMKVDAVKTLEEVFGCWGSIPEMASDVGVNTERAKKWPQRRRIPTAHWPALISAVARKGKKLSADDLLVMHSRRSAAQRAAR